ncbi:hypothetical protein F4782DRAFT_463459 [Xylaria castorea]|nr:hypothetical protein F4782DRAFT_463459 [Xylaria castorea]
MQFSTFFLAALSMGSAIASPLAGVQTFDNSVPDFANAKNVLEEQHAQISRLAGEASSAENTLEIQKCLLTVGQSMNGLFSPALALGNAGSTPLSKDQLSYVPQFAEIFLSIFVNVEAIANITTTRLNKDQLAKVQPELQLILSSPVLIARPVLAFISVAASSQTEAFLSVSHPLRNIQALLKVAVDLNIKLGLEIFVGLGIFI